jgi:ATP-dependent Clp protease adapter protein ClpS
MSDVIEKPDTADEVNDPKLGNHKHAVMAFNDDKTSFKAVMGVFIVSCGYTEEVAEKFTWEIHNHGSSLCYWNSRERCKEVIADFNKIGVKAELVQL